MRRALTKLKVAEAPEPVDPSNEYSDESEEQKRIESDKAKRIAVKKEGVDFEHKS